MNHLDHIAPPRVWLWRDHLRRPQAFCDCGWSGRPRFLNGHARLDAWRHSMNTAHMPHPVLDHWKAGKKLSREDRNAANLACLLMLLVPAAALFVSCSPPAHADPVDDYTVAQSERICTALQARPTDEGVVQVMADIRRDGFTGMDAATVLVDSVIIWCPDTMPVVQHFAFGDDAAPVVAV